MNDFHATPVNWANFLDSFHAAGLAAALQQALTNRDFEEASSLAEAFLRPWLWEQRQPQDDAWPMTLSFHGLGAVAASYPAMRQKMSEPVSAALDALVVPFAGQWMSFPGHNKKSSIPETLKQLATGGLSVALSSEACQAVANSLHATPWDRELQAAAEALAPEERAATLALIGDLAKLLEAATQRKEGLISVFEI